MMHGRFSVVWFWIGVSLFALAVMPMSGRLFSAGAQEPKRFQYKIVDVLTETQDMEITLNRYGADGWELVAVGMGDLTRPRLIFKK